MEGEAGTGGLAALDCPRGGRGGPRASGRWQRGGSLPLPPERTIAANPGLRFPGLQSKCPHPGRLQPTDAHPLTAQRPLPSEALQSAPARVQLLAAPADPGAPGLADSSLPVGTRPRPLVCLCVSPRLKGTPVLAVYGSARLQHGFTSASDTCGDPTSPPGHIRGCGWTGLGGGARSAQEGSTSHARRIWVCSPVPTARSMEGRRTAPTQLGPPGRRSAHRAAGPSACVWLDALTWIKPLRKFLSPWKFETHLGDPLLSQCRRRIKIVGSWTGRNPTDPRGNKGLQGDRRGAFFREEAQRVGGLPAREAPGRLRSLRPTDIRAQGRAARRVGPQEGAALSFQVWGGHEGRRPLL